MLVIRRLKLLAGVAMVLGLSTAATGCRSGGPYRTGGLSGDDPYAEMTSTASLGSPHSSRSQRGTATTPIVNPTGMPVAMGQPIASNRPAKPKWSQPQWMQSRRERREATQTAQRPRSGQMLPSAPPTAQHAGVPVLPPPGMAMMGSPGVEAPPQVPSSGLTQTSATGAIMLQPVPHAQVVPPAVNTNSHPVQPGEGSPVVDPSVKQVSTEQQQPLLILGGGTPPPSLTPAEFAGTPPLPSGPEVVSTSVPAISTPESRTSPLPMAPPLTVALSDPSTRNEPKDVPAQKPSTPDKSKSSILPPPRLKNGENKTASKTATPPGWPEIPAATVTNPPHAPREFQKHALSTYIIEPPDVLRIDGSQRVVGTRQLPIEGPHLVRPDGTIGLGTYGSVFVAGMTIDQAKAAVIQAIMRAQEESRAEEEKAGKKDAADNVPDEDKALPAPSFQDYWRGIRVDVAAYNSKFYYVITDGGGYGETVVRLPCTGNETVLDAISQIQGLPAVASKKKIWVARATPHDQHHPMILPVDWYGITQGGKATTNYQLFPGDRLYVNSDCRIRIDSHLAKMLSPIERLLGVTLLGATTVNAVKGNNFGGP